MNKTSLGIVFLRDNDVLIAFLCQVSISANEDDPICFTRLEMH